MTELGLKYEWPKSNVLCDAKEHFLYDAELDILNLNEVMVAGEIVPFGRFAHSNAYEISVPDNNYTYTRRHRTDDKLKATFDSEKSNLQKWIAKRAFSSHLSFNLLLMAKF